MSGISADMIKGWGTALVGAERRLFDPQVNPSSTAEFLDGVSTEIRRATVQLDWRADAPEAQALQGIAKLVDDARSSAITWDPDAAIWSLRDAGARLQLMGGAADQSSQGVYMLG